MLSRWFLTDDVPLALCATYHHQPGLVVVSYLIAAFAAYTAFHLIARVRAAGTVVTRLSWLATAGLSMGFGIWAMHFVAMLAVEIPIDIRYDLPITVLSAGFAVLASAIAFDLVADETTSRIRLGLAGVILGSGIGLMHYVGMAALSLPARIYYAPSLFALSVVVAVVLSTTALAILTRLRKLRGGRGQLAQLAGAAVMGLAIVLMHYTGMFATYFLPVAGLRQTGVLLDPSIMAAAIGVVALLLAGLALAGALFDQRVERAETLLRDAINCIAEGFVIYDSQDRLVICNDAYRRMYHESADLLVPGARLEDILRDGLAKGRYPGVHGVDEAWLAERMRQHRAAQGTIEQHLGDGSWVLSTDRRLSNGGLVGLRVNISALKTAQAALLDSEQRLDKAQEIAGIGSWEIDVPTGRAIWSKELYRIRGIPRETQQTQDSLEDTIHPDDWPRVREWLSGLGAGIPQEPIEYRIQRPDGERRIVSVEGQAVADASGTITKITGTTQDITDRRRTERQLVQAQKMETVGQLTGGMAHDFNNILGAVIGNLDLAESHAEPASTVAIHCHNALDAALRGAELVKRLLAFARRQVLHPRPTNLQGVIANLLPLVERTLGEHIQITTQCDARLWPAIADAAQLESAILNLIVNARDAMPHGGTLAIEAANVSISTTMATASGELQPGDYAVISVSDTGCGMPPEVLASAFEPFFTTKGPASGSGLGLSMVFGTMQQLGGTVHIYSEVGTGTTVRLYMPRADVSQNPRQQPAPSAEPIPTGQERILLVEDNVQIRTVGTAILRGLGYQVTVADSGDAGMQHIESGERFDLLFTDIVMPGQLNGLALARELRARDPAARILFTSGFSSPSMLREQIHELGGAELIAKPYRKAELAMLVRSMLNRTAETVA
jgi:PAS domain S-box-containing protein